MNEISLENTLRPKTIDEYIGQQKSIRALKLFIKGVLKRGQVSEHILLYGPPGIGKTTLASILALELQGELKITSGPAITKTGDLAAILTNLKDNDVLFIDEIHRLSKPVEEALYPVMEEFNLDIIIGKGPSARIVRLPVPHITIIGATTKLALLSAPLRDRFGMLLRLDFYNESEMVKIILRSATLLNISISQDIALEIAKRSRHTPRIANRILKRARDFFEVNSLKRFTKEKLFELFEILQIDSDGLNEMDKKYIKLIADKFSGGPVGLSTLSSALSEDKQTIEEFVEPYLIQKGYIKKTTQGRILIKKMQTLF